MEAIALSIPHEVEPDLAGIAKTKFFCSKPRTFLLFESQIKAHLL